MTSPTAALTVASIALATDMLVYGLAVPILPAIARAHGAPPAAIGLLFARYAAALLVSTPLVGRWIDRSGSRTPLLLGLIGLAAATLLFAVGGAFPLLLLARALQGVAAAASWTASLALIAATHPRRRGAAPWAWPSPASGPGPCSVRLSAGSSSSMGGCGCRSSSPPPSPRQTGSPVGSLCAMSRRPLPARPSPTWRGARWHPAS